MQAWLEKHSPIDVEDLERHDKWLCMMWPRHLLRELLSDDGAIFISIDDNEVHRIMRMLMDADFRRKQLYCQYRMASTRKSSQNDIDRFTFP